MPELARRGSGSSRSGAGRDPIRGPVRVVFLDVDGTLTDGSISFSAGGDGRSFWIRDGIALQWAREQGVLPVVISGRASPAVERRDRRGLDAGDLAGARQELRAGDRVGPWARRFRLRSAVSHACLRRAALSARHSARARGASRRCA